jgi:hypothetical protein
MPQVEIRYPVAVDRLLLDDDAGRRDLLVTNVQVIVSPPRMLMSRFYPRIGIGSEPPEGHCTKRRPTGDECLRNLVFAITSSGTFESIRCRPAAAA